MSIHHSIAAQVGAEIRRQMATRDWSWRHREPGDPIGARATSTLRQEAARACLWIEVAAAAIGMPLPAGNGTGGAWQRSAVIDQTDRLGIVDIAAGRIAWTDSVVPSYVRRFAVAVDRAQSPNQAGGSGGIPHGSRQVCLMYGTQGGQSPRIIRPRPSVTRIVWGFETCYGTIGERPSDSEYSSAWARLMGAGVPVEETDEPQRMRLEVTDGSYTRVQPELWADYARRQPFGSLKGVNLGTASHGRAHVYVRGRRPERETAQKWVQSTWPAFVRERALSAAEAVLRANSMATGFHDQMRREELLYAQRSLAMSLAPSDGLSDAERAEVHRATAALLARDPREVGLSYRDPWGRPGYEHGGNHLSYVIGSGRLTAHVAEQPGVYDWLRASRLAARAERERIGLLHSAGPVTADEIGLIERAGYSVDRVRPGTICCTMGLLQ